MIIEKVNRRIVLKIVQKIGFIHCKVKFVYVCVLAKKKYLALLWQIGSFSAKRIMPPMSLQSFLSVLCLFVLLLQKSIWLGCCGYDNTVGANLSSWAWIASTALNCRACSDSPARYILQNQPFIQTGGRQNEIYISSFVALRSIWEDTLYWSIISFPKSWLPNR